MIVEFSELLYSYQHFAGDGWRVQSAPLRHCSGCLVQPPSSPGVGAERQPGMEGPEQLQSALIKVSVKGVGWEGVKCTLNR